jgi:hypothetical protein
VAAAIRSTTVGAVPVVEAKPSVNIELPVSRKAMGKPATNGQRTRE